MYLCIHIGEVLNIKVLILIKGNELFKSLMLIHHKEQQSPD